MLEFLVFVIMFAPIPFFLIIILIMTLYFGGKYENIKKSMEIYGVSKEFVKKNKFYRSPILGLTRVWSLKQMENIINHFDDSPRKMFLDEDTIILYENGSILFSNNDYFWQYIPYDEIYDIRVSRRNTALKGAIRGKMILGDVGAYQGADRMEITLQVITKGFETSNYTLKVKSQSNIEEFSNMLYYLYDK